MSDAEIVRKLKEIPRELYSARQELFKVWFSSDRPRVCKAYPTGQFFF